MNHRLVLNICLCKSETRRIYPSFILVWVEERWKCSKNQCVVLSFAFWSIVLRFIVLYNSICSICVYTHWLLIYHFVDWSSLFGCFQTLNLTWKKYLYLCKTGPLCVLVMDRKEGRKNTCHEAKLLKWSQSWQDFLKLGFAWWESMQGGPLLVINGVVPPLNGILHGLLGL